MIEQTSPLTRRIVAVGLLVLMVLLGIQYVVAPLANAIAGQRSELAALRARETRLQATFDQRLPEASKVQSGQVVAAATAVQAAARLSALLAGDAAITGATLQLGPPCQAGRAAILCADIVISGKEADVAQFLSLTEHGSPLVRFQNWQIAPIQTGNAQLHITGHAVAVGSLP